MDDPMHESMTDSALGKILAGLGVTPDAILLLEALPEPIFISDKTGVFVWANQAAAELLNFDAPSDVISGNYTLVDFVVEEFRERAAVRLQQVLESKMPSSSHVVGQRFDGSRFRVKATTTPVLDKKQELLGMLTAAHLADESERDDLADSEMLRQFTNVFDASPDGTIIARGGEIIYANSTFVALMGAADISDVLGLRVQEVIHPDDWAFVTQMDNQMIETGEPLIGHPERLIRKDGTTVSTEVSASRQSFDGRIGALVTFRDVSERQASFDSLAESEECYRGLVESSPEAVIIVKDEKIIYANPTAIAMFGYKHRADLAGRQLSMLCKDGEVTEVRQLVRSVLDSRTAVSGKAHRFRRASSELFETSVSCAPAWYRGKVVAQLVIQDTTQQKRAENVLRDSELKWRILFESAPDPVLMLNTDGTVAEINAAGLRFTGHDSYEAMVDDIRSPFELMSTEDQQRALAAMKRYLGGDQLDSPNVYSMRNAAGQERRMSVRSVPIIDGEGDIAAIISTARDVTDQEAMVASIRESEANLAAMFDQSALGLARISVVGEPDRFNDSFQQLLGYSEEELRGLNPAQLTHPEDFQADYDLMMEVISGARDSYTIEKRMSRKDGAYVWVELSVTIVRKTDGSPWYALSTLADISARKELESQLIQSEKLGAIGELLSGAAHEINNPLAVVMANAQLISRSSGDGKIKDSANLIRKHAGRASRVVDGLLAFSRSQVPKKAVVDIRGAAEEALLLYSASMDFEIVDTIVDQPDDACWIYADMMQIEQVILNLLINGGQSVVEQGNGPGEVRLTITRDSESPEEKIRVEVSDSGGGIPDKIRGRVFEPFFTTKPVGEGTGLGLSIAYGLVQENDGEIFCSNNDSGGATFTVVLPLVPGLPEGNQYIKGIRAGQQSTISTIVYDDDTSLGRVITSLLAPLGHSLTFVGSPIEAIAEVINDRADKALCGISSEAEYFESLRTMVQNESASLAGRVVLAATPTDTAVAELASKAGVDLIYTPYRLEDIADSMT